MSIVTLSHTMSRLERIRAMIAAERHTAGENRLRMLRLKALLLRAQERLARVVMSAVVMPSLQPIPIRAGASRKWPDSR